MSQAYRSAVAFKQALDQRLGPVLAGDLDATWIPETWSWREER